MLYALFKASQGCCQLPSAERPFEVLAPLKEKHFLPDFEFFFDSLKSDPLACFLSSLRLVGMLWGNDYTCIADQFIEKSINHDVTPFGD